MAIPVLIIGKSGSGKSTSLRNFNEKELAFVNVIKNHFLLEKNLKAH